jgi:hypothetical protein
LVKKILDEADLAYVRIELLNSINRYEEELGHVWIVFIIGLGSLLATLLLVNANMLDRAPLTGFLALICLIGPVYVKILYPPKVARMKETLEQLDDMLKLGQALPTNVRRNMGRRFLQTHEDLTRDFMRWDNRISLFESYGVSVSVFAVGLTTLIIGVIRGYLIESFFISGPITVAGIVMVLLKYRERNQSLPLEQ